MKLHLILFLIDIVFLSSSLCAENDCPSFCTLEYRPICATDGINPPRLFSNPSRLKSFSCINNVELKEVARTHCQDEL
ncbi:PI-actitoxin-Avd5a-like [Schistocerca gregaria]|uniref:PI-actitoxin-Avd5a-like n=1 Tax=Schistocerca gregaria TaxID=7010 RepID=UPI00211DCBE0|nr:PI-actitoxin-Avd5a-like [Schistocerca gregaria]